MKIVLWRIDDRLVHGQVMTAWSKVYKTTKILVIDDVTAKDSFLCQVMKLAVPGDYQVDIVSVDEAVKRIREDSGEKATMVLVKGPETIERLLEAGVTIPELNVGNMGAAPGRKAIMRSLQVTKEEFASLQAIREKGVRVYIQVFPDAKVVELDKIKY